MKDENKINTLGGENEIYKISIYNNFDVYYIKYFCTNKCTAKLES